MALDWPLCWPDLGGFNGMIIFTWRVILYRPKAILEKLMGLEI